MMARCCPSWNRQQRRRAPQWSRKSLRRRPKRRLRLRVLSQVTLGSSWASYSNVISLASQTCTGATMRFDSLIYVTIIINYCLRQSQVWQRQLSVRVLALVYTGIVLLIWKRLRKTKTEIKITMNKHLTLLLTIKWGSLLVCVQVCTRRPNDDFLWLGFRKQINKQLAIIDRGKLSK